MQTIYLWVLIHILIKGEFGAPWNWFKPSSKIFYWSFQGGTYFVDLLCFFLSNVYYAFVRVCLYVSCGHLLGKGWPLGSRLCCLTVSLSLSRWYPGSAVVLDCIDSWSLYPHLLCTYDAKRGLIYLKTESGDYWYTCNCATVAGSKTVQVGRAIQYIIVQAKKLNL